MSVFNQIRAPQSPPARGRGLKLTDIAQVITGDQVAPRFTPSMASAVKDLELAHLWVLYPGDRAYPLADTASTLPLVSLADRWHYE